MESRHLLIPKTGPLLPFLRVSLRPLPVPISIASGLVFPAYSSSCLNEPQGPRSSAGGLSVKKDQRSQIAYLKSNISQESQTLTGVAARCQVFVLKIVIWNLQPVNYSYSPASFPASCMISSENQ